MKISGDGCLFFAAILVGFSIGVHLQSVENLIVEGLPFYICVAVILIVMAVERMDKTRRKRNESNKN